MVSQGGDDGGQKSASPGEGSLLLLSLQLIIFSLPSVVKCVSLCLTRCGPIIHAMNVKLTLNVTLYHMKSISVLFLFELEQCVEHVFYELN